MTCLNNALWSLPLHLWSGSHGPLQLWQGCLLLLGVGFLYSFHHIDASFFFSPAMIIPYKISHLLQWGFLKAAYCRKLIVALVSLLRPSYMISNHGISKDILSTSFQLSIYPYGRPPRFAGFKLWYHCNDPKPLCKDHHCFGVFSKTFSEWGILSNSLLIYLFDVLICVYVANNRKR